ncbi:hypothetical protein ANN_11808 [Periplaneta americana]|uniref:Uncharacterized protein n=1 Tax=Periplaneta americana TaxID=6978 RepID=A0ABQ8T627_PERAM|nr:hypothetical protein ANN_11808 [Periplaneta americana]
MLCKMCNKCGLRKLRILTDGRGNHLHPPNVTEARVRQVLNGIRRRAGGNPTESPGSVVRQELAGVHNEQIIVSLPQRNAVIRMVSYQQKLNRPPLPQSIREIDTVDWYSLKQ